jgi:hypothetical protein
MQRRWLVVSQFNTDRRGTSRHSGPLMFERRVYETDEAEAFWGNSTNHTGGYMSLLVPPTVNHPSKEMHGKNPIAPRKLHFRK